jgi:hypothetical protein
VSLRGIVICIMKRSLLISTETTDLEKHADLGIMGSYDGYGKMYANVLTPRFE